MVKDILTVFPDARVASSYVRVRCPYHKGGHERRPSMSILLVDRGDAPAGHCHCFTCGKNIMFYDLARDLGYDFPGDHTAASSLPTKRGVTLTPTQRICKAQLPYRFSPYLQSRGIGEGVQRRFKVYEKDGMVHMPIFDGSGYLLYDNARSTTRKFFQIEANARKSLWGIEEVDLTRPLAICESQIDAMSFWQVGLQAVATLGADNIASLEVLKQSSSIFILAFDPDEAGIRARHRAAKLLGKYRCNYVDFPQGVDVNKCLTDIGNETTFVKYIARITRKYRTV